MRAGWLVRCKWIATATTSPKPTTTRITLALFTFISAHATLPPLFWPHTHWHREAPFREKAPSRVQLNARSFDPSTVGPAAHRAPPKLPRDLLSSSAQKPAGIRLQPLMSCQVRRMNVEAGGIASAPRTGWGNRGQGRQTQGSSPARQKIETTEDGRMTEGRRHEIGDGNKASPRVSTLTTRRRKSNTSSVSVFIVSKKQDDGDSLPVWHARQLPLA